MLLPAKIFLFWQVVAFQNIEIILDMIQGCELRFQFFQGCSIGFFLCLQGIIEKAFYAGKGSEPDAPSDGKKETPKAEDPETQEGMSPEKLAKLLTNPEVINMLKVLSKTMGPE